MWLKKSSCVLLFLLVGFLNSKAQEKYSKVKVIIPSTLQERNKLLGLLEIDHFYQQEGAIISEISDRVLKKLVASNAPFQVLVDDVAKNLKEENSRYYASKRGGTQLPNARVAFEQKGANLDAIIKVPAAFMVHNTFGGYYNYAQMSAAMDKMVTDYPGIVQKISIGKSAELRDIWAIKISDNVATDEEGEPEVLYTGLQHAREAIGGSSLIFFMEYLLENYSKDTRIKNLVDNREFYIVPCVNPDGWEYNRSLDADGGGGWRKNRRVVGTVKVQGKNIDEYGVDLNRNYGVDWGNCPSTDPSCGSSDISSDTYYGPSKFSEPETQAIRDLVYAHRFVASIDQHAYGPYYSVPYGRPSLHPALSATDKKFYTAIPALMGTYNGMRAGNSPESVGYEVAGGIKDWLLMGDIGTGTKGKIYGMTGEGGAGGGTGGSYGSFWAPAGEIINLSQGMCFQNLQLAYAAGSYVNMQDVSDIVVTKSTDAFSFKLTRIGLGNEAVTVSLLPLENIQTAGAPLTISSLPNYYDTYTGAITYALPSAITNGQRIRFIWKVETGGYSYSDTITKFYNPELLFADDMEGTSVSTNWTVSSGWNYATDDKYSGSKSLTESPGVKYGTSAAQTATYNKTFNLTNATAVYLSFWVKHRAENFRDKLQVQVSTNGTTWVAVAGSTTVQEPGVLDGSTINGQPSLTGIREDWTPEVFDLSPYKGTTNLQLRFAFTSDGDGGSFTYEKDEGFFIDDLEVVKSSSPLIVLPVRFIDFYGKVLTDKSVQLTWQAITDEQHDYFEVERSADGIHFSTIGKGLSNVPYQYLDKAPISGVNFYRIKQIDKNKNTLYGKVIKLHVQSIATINAFPNPVTNKVKVKWTGAINEAVTIQVTDMQGHIIHRQDCKVESGSECTIDAGNWKPQVYILKLLNKQKEELGTQKITKL